ncbi:MAG: TonB-dependent receptor [Gammaproteobacteria bacterium]|nr:TonB-dependent receptor [Gammaproteobacteria bacterium]
MSNNTQSNTVLGETFPLRDLPKSTTDKFGFYLQDEIAFGNFTLIPALRWDYYNLNASTDEFFPDSTRLTNLSSDDLTLRLGATWRITDSLSLYGHYAEGFRAPPAEDVNLFLDITLFNYRAIPNPDLKPERSQNLEAGFRFQAEGTSITAGAYLSRYDDFIESRALVGMDLNTGGLLFQSRNLEEASIYGVETSVSQALEVISPKLRDWFIDAGLHWAHGNNDSDDSALNSVSPLKVVGHLRWNPEGLPVSAELSVTHYGSQSRVDFSTGEFFVPEAATVSDLLLQWQQSDSLRWTLGVYNIGDKRYWRYSNVRRLKPNDPRVELVSQPGINAALTLQMSY